MGHEEEEHRGNAVDDDGEDVLERVDALEFVAEQQAHEGEVEHALCGAEVAAVGAGDQQSEEQGDAAVGVGVGAVALAAAGEGPGEPGLEDDEDQGDADERGDDGVECLRREREQEYGAGESADEGGDAEADDAAALAERVRGGSRWRR
ncbi:hypothetical protein GCM10020000_62990 [Streptomyces olivoverticillatus]